MDSACHIFKTTATVVLLMCKSNPGLAGSESQRTSIFLKSKWAQPSFQHSVLQVQNDDSAKFLVFVQMGFGAKKNKFSKGSGQRIILV